ncbi:hypothetical protein [Microbacterium sp. LEMMJ01]|uniref:hypothetical protein n=1 Tax=Microbacterium sp. LEMMJ01 TaxID=1978350 RepID=UPI000A1DEE27|nr:hypothetical protein [Microbacterium sp. LEMMJ01]OSO98767.1 hypothetical protein B7W94_14700 [Microbacterium sp. LEMMJ01]
MRVPITDAAELAASQELARRLHQVDRLTERYSTVAQLRAKPTSELGDDDRRTHWLQLSHYVSACMSMATDSLLATKQLLMPDGKQLEHRITSQFPLLRSTLESAATALWLLQPADQRDRIVRLLQLRTTDIDYNLRFVKAAVRLIDNTTREGRSAAQRGIRDATKRRRKHREQLATIAEANDITPDEYTDGAPGYERIVEEATDSPDLTGAHASTVWRMISGLTHPSPLRVTDTSKHGATIDNDDGTLYVLSSMGLGTTTVALLAAMMTYRQATELLGARILRVKRRP